jgi:RHS repeat-associated protein
MISKIDRNGNTTAYLYDAHDRLISQTVTGAGLTTKDNQVFYTYDNNDNQLSMKDGTGLTSRTYDELNRVITKSVPGMGTSTFLLDQTTGLTAGFVSEVTTDVKGNVTTKVYDKTNRLSEVKDGDTLQASYAYFADGSQQQVTYASGAKEIYAYYKNNQLKSLDNYQGTTLLDTYTYTYDNADNQLSKTEKVNGVEKGTTNFDYDVLNRLQKVTEPNGKITEYTFDQSGNRLSENTTLGAAITLISYGYNEQNRLLGIVEIKSIGETQQVNYAYDNNGNLINKTTEIRKKVDPGNLPTPTFGLFIYGQSNPNPRIADVLEGVARYEYDGFNQLIKTATGSSGAIYAYNGDGLRVKKTADGVTTSYLYEYDKVVLETDGNGKKMARNLYGLNLVSRTMGSDKYFYLYNGHADVTALITPSGVIASSYEYDAFGYVTNTTGTVSNPIRYAGYQYDEESKLYYLNARHYDPQLARFLTEDTYRGQANDPLSLNMYTYVHNEPIMYTDPTGHAATSSNATVLLKDVVKEGYSGSISWNNTEKVATIIINGQSVRIKADGKDAAMVNGRVIIKPETLDKLYNNNNVKTKGNTYISTTATVNTIMTKIIEKGEKTVTNSIINNYKPSNEISKIINDVVGNKSINLEQINSLLNITKFECQGSACVQFENLTTDQYADSYLQKSTDKSINWGLTGTSTLADIIPFVGNGKSLIEVFTGKDLVDGNKLSSVDKWITVAGIILPEIKIIKRGKTAKKLFEVSGKGDKISNTVNDVKEYLGPGAKTITNNSGDKVFISADGTKRVRFDINNPSPHNNPHAHVEELVNGKWVKSGQIYPTDVPHN